MANKEVAIKKRAMIDKATSTMLIVVSAAAVVLGCSLVLSVYFIKWMVFNGKVIGAKDAVIKDYKTSQQNLSTLANNVSALSSNENLEVIARDRETGCIRNDGGPVDTSDDIELARICSALRVIPDALPSTANEVAVYSSLNKLFLDTKDENGNSVNPENISPGNTNSRITAPVAGLSVVPVSLSIKNTSTTTKAVLDTIERSIRNFDVQSVNISWRSNEQSGNEEIELQGSATAYYSSGIEAKLKIKTIYADDKNAPKTKSSGSN